MTTIALAVLCTGELKMVSNYAINVKVNDSLTISEIVCLLFQMTMHKNAYLIFKSHQIIMTIVMQYNRD